MLVSLAACCCACTRLTEQKFVCREDNEMRKHNFLPLMFTMLRLLAQRGELQPLIDKAKAAPS